MFVSYSVKWWQQSLPFEKGGIIVKKKLAAALLVVLVCVRLRSVKGRS